MLALKDAGWSRETVTERLREPVRSNPWLRDVDLIEANRSTARLEKKLGDAKGAAQGKLADLKSQLRAPRGGER